MTTTKKHKDKEGEKKGRSNNISCNVGEVVARHWNSYNIKWSSCILNSQ
jgi:hypothetical protein